MGALRLEVAEVRAEAPDVAGLTLVGTGALAGSGTLAAWRHVGRDRASLPLSGEPAPARVFQRPDDEYGGPPSAAELPDALTPDTAVCCCGPPAMIDAVRRAMPPGYAFHSERFSPPPIRGGRALAVGIGDDRIAVPADRSALDAVLAVRPGTAYSCRQGFCGTCHVPLPAGVTTHDTAGPGRMAPCVARAAGDTAVVDL